MNVSGCSVFCMEEFSDTPLLHMHFCVGCHLSDCPSAAICHMATKWNKTLVGKFNLYCRIINIYLWHLNKIECITFKADLMHFWQLLQMNCLLSSSSSQTTANNSHLVLIIVRESINWIVQWSSRKGSITASLWQLEILVGYWLSQCATFQFFFYFLLCLKGPPPSFCSVFHKLITSSLPLKIPVHCVKGALQFLPNNFPAQKTMLVIK